MTAPGADRWRDEPPTPPGDDQVPAPPPVKETPPADSFCNIVLTGGVASGVVYPWAIVELARAFRFRKIGGTSVGAMAAALAAAAEYGRRCGFTESFEPLRRAPADLAADMGGGRTRMLSLFLPRPRGRRLMWIWGRLLRGSEGREALTDEQRLAPQRGMVWRALGLVLQAYAAPLSAHLATAAWVTVALFVALGSQQAPGWAAIVHAGLAVLAWAVFATGWTVWRDLRDGLIRNHYGLCRGAADPSSPGHGGLPAQGLTDWLHEGIQLSAGLKIDDRPLTFGELWSAPAHPGAPHQRCGADDPPEWRAIDLQLITTNVTHGRPYRLPDRDRTSRLFFLPDELEGYFPPPVLQALKDAGQPYRRQCDPGDPPVGVAPPGLLELPVADLPVVVAARLSLSFPLLFSAVPLWAIDFETMPRTARTFRRCVFSDGGVSSNFPIHLFDESVPRWPTFGLWLDRRTPFRHHDPQQSGQAEAVWLPPGARSGWGDNWDRFDPKSKAAKTPPASSESELEEKVARLGDFLLGILASAKDWRDRTAFRLPHVRNRVVRMMLLPDEGGLHIGMPRRQILDMAHRYGTTAGRRLVQRFTRDGNRPSPAWEQQRWLHFNGLVDGLRNHLHGLRSAAAWSGAGTTPLPAAIQQAQSRSPLLPATKDGRLTPAQALHLEQALRQLETLEALLDPGQPATDLQPRAELRLRPPL